MARDGHTQAEPTAQTRQRADKEMSIRAMEREISNQAENLPRFASQLRQKHRPKIERSSLIFAGSGDSYAAAVFAQEVSQGEAIASDPYELLTNIRRTRGKTLVIVSVSGRTRTNVELARNAKEIARRTLAITADPESPLGRECDETLRLSYRAAGTLTSGTVSFTTSLLACAFLVGNIPRIIQAKTGVGDATLLARRIRPVAKGSFVFTGSGVNYALSLYGAAKINEVLGAKAEAVYPEQLGHAKLFAIDKKRDVFVCISSGRDKATETHELLSKYGFHSSILTVPVSHVVNQSLKIAIYLQRLALSLARGKGIEECAFLTDKNRLKLSNRMIY